MVSEKDKKSKAMTARQMEWAVKQRLNDLENHLYACEERYLDRTAVYGNVVRSCVVFFFFSAPRRLTYETDTMDSLIQEYATFRIQKKIYPYNLRNVCSAW